MTDNINLIGLFPDFHSVGFSLETGEQLSALFVSALIIISSCFFLWSLIVYFVSLRRIGWLSNLVGRQNISSVTSNRHDLIEKAKKRKGQEGHLWLEFDETLLEVEHNGELALLNTLDARHFFNNSTLASGITESRMLAAVPGFLTALGVIGTFVGLQLGLSELNIGNDVSVEEMKTGLAQVISGAKIAFMTSVWGVTLSVLFNFFEKWLAGSIRKNIHKLQNKIDQLFPRISAEFQLQRIADDGKQSRESLQGLAEKIGEKMQESLLQVTKGIQASLESSLEKIMAPAINKLVDETSDGNQKALNTLIDTFLERFGVLGSNQRVAMDNASLKVNEALNSLSSTMGTFLKKLDQNQNSSAEREKELIATISTQVSQLVGQSAEQGKMLTEYVEKQLSGLSKAFDERDHISGERDRYRQAVFVKQAKEVKESTETLLSRIEDMMNAHVSASNALIEQGKVLQAGLDESVQANVEASSNMKTSANELKAASTEMNDFGSQISYAGSKLSGAIAGAVNSTSNLAEQNQLTSKLISEHRQQLVDDRAQFNEVAERLQSLILSADSIFDKMREHQNAFLHGLEDKVSALAVQMTTLLSDYASRANSQTEQHLDLWARHTTNYAEQMKSAYQALSNVVEEIEDKLSN
ncbi:anti-phage ZorAB system protein ZorA [Desulfofustis glycolicus]|uniref:Uncharacterized protein n=1 Tax=Desulfofustis glycolicus DSM 9705 TaxID=1121409 RepID=A0A1M5XPQ7_9BACT|nr:anti-phage ZorAB system protein ZorA [Desulfofustis glycolicus]SHI01825.1 hypothetical protein SAMN02745124_03234 [Desulfofustis glycolicus DSM 9705]